MALLAQSPDLREGDGRVSPRADSLVPRPWSAQSLGQRRAQPGWHRALWAGLGLQHILSSQEGAADPQKHEGCRPPQEGVLQGEHPEGLGRPSALMVSLSLGSTFFLIFSMTDGVGTTGASHYSLQCFPALLGRQIPQGQVSKHPTWEVVAGDGARWAQPAGSFLFALLLILEPAPVPVYSCIQAHWWETIHCSTNYKGKLWKYLYH